SSLSDQKPDFLLTLLAKARQSSLSEQYWEWHICVDVL
ncbi:hypothetical protein A2U01_0097356, partial [Trifolium medium]|nr:hypothetical protein [Trifolium medium]